MKTTFLFKLSSPDSDVDDRSVDAAGRGHEGAVGKAAARSSISDADFMAMATGQADAMKLFSAGKLKISGDVMASQKLGFLKKIDAGDGARRDEEAHRRGAARGGGAPRRRPRTTRRPSTTRSSDRGVPQAEPRVAEKVGVVYQLEGRRQARGSLDLKNGAAASRQGEGAAECTLELAEADFLAMTQGKADPMKLFTTGKLKISGNVMASQKLQFLSKIDPSKAIEGDREAPRRRRRLRPQRPQPAAAAAPKAGEPNAPKFFAALAKRLAENPGLEQRSPRDA